MNLVPRIPVPTGKALLPYQEDGVRWMLGRRAMLVADEMGLGKTITACGFINCYPRIRTVLVVCPASMRLTWYKASVNWLTTRPETFTVLSYEKMVQLDKTAPWDLVIFDEAHYLKNKDAIRSREARKVKARVKVLLSGSPIPDRPIDGWHLLHLLNPEKFHWKTYYRYGVKFCGGKQVYVSRRKKVWDFTGASHLDELANVLAPVMLRRLKRDVATQIPPKTRRVVEFPMEGLKKDVLDLIAVEAELAITDYSTARRELGIAKIPLAASFIENMMEQNIPTVVFAHHLEVIEQLTKRLKAWSPVVLTGATSEIKRNEAIEKFMGGGTNLFIGQMIAAGTGITLTRSSHVVFAEQSWQPGVIQQAEDRVHRVTQDNPVTIYYLVFENSLDARMAKKWAGKQEDIDLIVDGGKR